MTAAVVVLCEPFRFTYGWGSLGTITVGVLAIIASTIFNLATLKRSAETLKMAEDAYQRTEERYVADRLEARNERVRAAVFDAAHKAGQIWPARCTDYLIALMRHIHNLRMTVAPSRMLSASAEALVAVMQGPLQDAISEALSALDSAEFLAADHPEISAELELLRDAFYTAIQEPSMTPDTLNDPDEAQERVDNMRTSIQIVIQMRRRLLDTAREALTAAEAKIDERQP